MNIIFKPNSNIEDRTNAKGMSRHSVSPLEISKFNTSNRRPLEQNVQNLSFKGLSSKVHIIDGIEAIINKFAGEFGLEASKNFEAKIKQADSIKKISGLSLNGDSVTITEKSFGERFLKTLSYPLLEMPLDITNAALEGLKKIPGIKNSNLLKRVFNSKLLSNRRIIQESISIAHSLETYAKLTDKSGFEKGQKRFDLSKSNSDAVLDRTLNRIVTGSIPAFFLANDAYNLSIYMKNDKKEAKQEKQRRFNQEVSRIAITGASIFMVLSLFSKQSNKNQNFTAALMTLVTLISEITGRMIAGNPILPVNKEQAKEYAQKQGKIKPEQINKNPEFSSNLIENKTKQSKEKSKDSKKGGLTLGNVAKVLGALIVFGWGVEKARKVEIIKDLSTRFVDKYHSLYNKEFTMSEEAFKNMTEKLKKNGFAEVAEQYEGIKKDIIASGNISANDLRRINIEMKKQIKQAILQDEKLKSKKLSPKEREVRKNEIAKNITKDKVIKALGIKANNNVINMGETSVLAKEVIIHHLLTFPIRYAWQLIQMPYRAVIKIDKAVDAFIIKTDKKDKALTPDEMLEKSKEMLKKSTQFMKKIDKNPSKIEEDSELKNKITKTILSSFDEVSKSEFSNADIGATVKNATSAVTSAFLIADNYNLVMIDSQGEDKNLAKQKAKERTIQRAVRLLYGAFIIKLYNNAFSRLYNGSLTGASIVNSMYAVSTETLERTSVGLPLHEATREEIIEKDRKNLTATGIKGNYFKFMAKLTGKKPLPNTNENKK